VKRIVVILDGLAISVTIFILFILVVVGVCDAVVGAGKVLSDLYHDRHNAGWLGGFIVFCLVWAVFRWKAGLRALEELRK